MKRLFLILTAMLFSVTANASFEDVSENVQTANVHFATDKSTLSSSAKATLSKLKIADASEVIIIGKADTRGDLVYNVKLGMSRANTVSDFLNASTASISSVGESDATGTTPEGMHNDRVVLVKVITPVATLHPLFGDAMMKLQGPASHIQYDTIPLGQGSNRITSPRM